MSVLNKIFDRLMHHEGGYVNHPNDPGGETMWGVTKRVARAHGYTGSMRNLPKSTAKAIFKKSYYDAVKGGLLDPAIAAQVSDAAYNHGSRRAVKFLQAAVGASQDGLIGPRTLAAVKSMEVAKVLFLYNAERLEYYTDLQHWRSFGKGWARRVAGQLRYAAEDI